MTTPTKWLKLSFSCPEKVSEAASDLVGVLSGVGVEIRPLQDSSKATITGFFALDATGSDTELQRAAAEEQKKVTAELEKLFAIYNLILSEPVTEIMADEDWATSWQQFFSAFAIIPGLVIKPSWEEYRPVDGERVITMDPGMAFGTGQHASTRLALSLMASRFKNSQTAPPKKILDVGTGTGILAMAGAVFGADQIMAIDNDPEAVQVALHNVLGNLMDWNIGVSSTPLAEVQGSFELICANIVHDVLAVMAPDFRRLLSPGGSVILSGILQGGQEENLERIFRTNGLHLISCEYDGEWAAMLFAAGNND